jgi:hypothetical protein
VARSEPWRIPRLKTGTALAMGTALLLVAAVVGMTSWRSSQGAALRLPADPAMADLYLQARDDWALRTPVGLRKSIVELGEVIRRDPRFAPAYASLADAYLLSPEFDSMPQGEAFLRAQAVANKALAMDPDNAEANRALGFISYWWRHDLKAARRRFAQSLRQSPQAAQTHFWYGNALMDNGEVAAGMSQLREARLLDPGSPTIQADYAWARWENGSGQAGVEDLRALEDRAPGLSTPPYYLALIALASADIAGYLDEAEKWASLQGGPDLIEQIASQRAAFRKGGAQAVEDQMAAGPQTANSHVQDGTIWLAGGASLGGRRDRLLELLARAEATGERWNGKRWERSMFSRWSGDAEVQARLKRLFNPVTPKTRMADAGV